MATVTEAAPGHDVESEQRVTPLELFFDLVFVFALTQVTGMLAGNPTWEGMARGMLVLAALWWAWAAYAWLTNTVDPDEDRARLTMFAAMAAMLIVALAAPGAFGEHALLFACAYFVVRAIHIVLYAVATDDVGVRGAVYRLAPVALGAPAAIIAASALDGLAQGLVWAVALVLDYAWPAIRGMEGWTVSPGHFAERHGLIVIIALGESIVAIGAAGLDLDAGVVVAALLGIAIAAALWWAYFDVVAVVAERRFRETSGPARLALARDSYSYLHLPMIVGIILVALGIKKTLGDVDKPLETVPAVALCGGVALYFLGHIGFRLRNLGTLNRQRLATVGLCVALIPLATEVDALAALAAVAGACWLLIAYEAVRLAEARARIRGAVA